MKSCPFCGGEASIHLISHSDERSGYNSTYGASCGKCGATVSRITKSDDNGWCNEEPGSVKARVQVAWDTRV